MTTKEMIAVMQAYLDGKQIQCRVACNGELHWGNISNPVWNWKAFDYRIKPEEEKPGLMTNGQLAEWCAGNNGQVRNWGDPYIRTYYNYGQGEDDTSVGKETLFIRPWGSDEWITPTVEIYERDCKGVK